MIAIERLSNAEYAFNRAGCSVQNTRFGVFSYQNEGATQPPQLSEVRCTLDEVHELLRDLDELCEPLQTRQRWISGYDASTFRALNTMLSAEGFTPEIYWALSLELPSRRVANRDIEFAVLNAENAADATHVFNGIGVDDETAAYIASQSARLGGQMCIAYCDEKPAGVAGWYSHDNVVRFTCTGTHPDFRSKGVATSLICHICGQSEVKAADAIMVCSDEQGPLRLYEELGFVRSHFFYNFYRD